MFLNLRFVTVFVLTSAALSLPALSVQPSEELLPNTTQGWLSIAHLVDFEEQFDQTQFGQLIDDEMMKPFREDFEEQIAEEFDSIREKLGFEPEDLSGISKGELSLALISKGKEPAVIAMIADITGTEAKADELLAKIEKEFTSRGGGKQLAKVGGDELMIFTTPATDKKPANLAVYIKKDSMLCGIDDRQEAEALLKRFSGKSADNLASIEGFQTSIARCEAEAGSLKPDVRWYGNPFEFIWAYRTLDNDAANRDKDVAKILYDSGFSAIKAAAGFVNLLVEPDFEVVHRSFVWAPPTSKKPNDPLRWTSSMRMMQLPDSKELEPEPWVPRMCASYTTINLDIQTAFDNAAPVFDGFAGYKDAFADTMKGYAEDSYGPKVNIRDEFVAYMGDRVSIVTDYTTPITTTSERSVYAIAVNDAEPFFKALSKIMGNDPEAKKRNFGDVVIWELVEPEYEFDDFELESTVAGTSTGEEEEEEEELILANSAVCFAEGYLMMGSDVNYVREILSTLVIGEPLVDADDYKEVYKAMAKLAPGPRSGWSFARMDEAIRPTYELIRQGKMPESETTVGELLNELLTTEEEEDEGILRRQQVDGSKLPEFEMVRRYFGPAGRVTRSDEDGWLITGATLNKEKM